MGDRSDTFLVLRTSKALERSPSDAEILEVVRGGELDAYDVLYERHAGAARRLANALLRNQADADDVVSEVFASVLSVIRRGKGPRDGFGPYLMASVRNECYRVQRRRGRMMPLAEPDGAPESDVVGLEPDPFARRDEADMVQQALRSLPSRWREVLWRTEVEGQSHEEIAEVTGTTPQAVAAQALRARRALGGAYLKGHLAPTATGESTPLACLDARGHLADLVRGSLTSRRRRRVEAHVADCPACRDAREELDRVNQHLRTAPGLAAAASLEAVRRGLRARLMGWFCASSVQIAAATGFVVVTATVPLVVAQHATGERRVTSVAEPASAVPAPPVPIDTTPSPGGASGVGTGDLKPAATTPPSTSQPRRRTRAHTQRGPETREPADRPARTARRHSDRSTRRAAGTMPPGTTTPRTDAPTNPAPAGNGPAASPPALVPGVTTPAVSVPAISLPVVTTPSVTVPSVSIPPITVPPVTVPPVTVPPVTVPPTTLAPVTLPPTTLPEVTVPTVTVPPLGG